MKYKKKKALTELLFTVKINKPLSNNLYVFLPSQTAKFQTKIKTTTPLQPLKYRLYNGNGKTILVKEMLIELQVKQGLHINTSHTSHGILVDRQCLDCILSDITVCNNCHFSQDF